MMMMMTTMMLVKMQSENYSEILCSQTEINQIVRHFGKMFYYHSRMRVGNVFSRVCLFVCVSVCLSVCVYICSS